MFIEHRRHLINWKCESSIKRSSKEFLKYWTNYNDHLNIMKTISDVFCTETNSRRLDLPRKENWHIYQVYPLLYSGITKRWHQRKVRNNLTHTYDWYSQLNILWFRQKNNLFFIIRRTWRVLFEKQYWLLD